MTVETIKLTVGKYRYPVRMVGKNGRLYFQFPFNKNLMAEIKAMQGSKYVFYQESENKEWAKETLGSDKIWSITDSHRNWFQLKTMMGENMYARYDGPVKDVKPNRLILRSNQKAALNFIMARHFCILAAEMGLGKTLVAFEVMEHSGHNDWFYVAPKGVLKEIQRQLRQWKCTVTPKLMTYEGLVKEMKNWPKGQKAPHGVMFDEASRAKNPFAVRSTAAQALADGIRTDHGDDGFVVEMSGSPSPKAPTDWWSLCEIACPGFLREGDVDKFKMRLGIFEESDSAQGQKFLKKVAWRDDDRRCNICGEFEEHIDHSPAAVDHPHGFVKTNNEVSYLYKRMDGLVLVQLKKDVLDLPEKQYRLIECVPSKAMLRAASSIANRTTSAAQTLILLRELSDGFQYQEEACGESDCEICGGTGECDDYESTDTSISIEEATMLGKVVKIRASCYMCSGTGKVTKFIRETREVECPKEEALRDLMDQHYDVGRMVVYAGFTGSIDRCCRIAKAEGWAVIRVDGSGWKMTDVDGSALLGEGLDIFQDQLEQHPRVCFIGHPGSAGMGLTLTASPSVVYYSNDFSAENRIQSEDRIHRLGMNETRGATIYDLIHLPTDLLVLNNLKEKRRLQAMTMGVIHDTMRSSSDERLF